MSSESSRVKQLDGLRVIFIFLIFLGHMGFIYVGDHTYPYGFIFRDILSNSDLAVDYYFMLSGFGLYLASMKKAPEKVSAKACFSFAWRRIRKIYPFYLFSMLLMVPFQLQLIQTGHVNPVELHSLLTRTPFLLTLTQSLFGVKSFSRKLNSVCWFLSTLFLLYLMCPPLLSLFRKKTNNLRQSIIVLLLSIAGLLVFSFIFLNIHLYGIFGKKTQFDLYYGSPYIRIFYLVIGMMHAAMYSHLNTRLKVTTSVECAVLILGALYYIGRNLIPSTQILPAMILRCLDILVCMSTLEIFSLGHGHLSALLISLSGFSQYVIYIYLFHYPLRYYVELLFNLSGIYFGTLTGIFEILIILALTLLTAMACVRLQRRKFPSHIIN